MTRREFLARKSVRAAAILWFVAFPILFITIPVIEIMMGDREDTSLPIYAFAVWILGPVAFGVVIKHVFPRENEIAE